MENLLNIKEKMILSIVNNLNELPEKFVVWFKTDLACPVCGIQGMVVKCRCNGSLGYFHSSSGLILACENWGTCKSEWNKGTSAYRYPWHTWLSSYHKELDEARGSYGKAFLANLKKSYPELYNKLIIFDKEISKIKSSKSFSEAFLEFIEKKEELEEKLENKLREYIYVKLNGKSPMDYDGFNMSGIFPNEFECFNDNMKLMERFNYLLNPDRMVFPAFHKGCGVILECLDKKLWNDFEELRSMCCFCPEDSDSEIKFLKDVSAHSTADIIFDIIKFSNKENWQKFISNFEGKSGGDER